MNSKTIALDFLQFARAGDRAAAQRLLTPDARHHNPYFPAGMRTLLDAIEDAAKAAPGRISDVKRVVAEGDYVVVHSHVCQNSDDLGASVVHIFRLVDDRRALGRWPAGTHGHAER